MCMAFEVTGAGRGGRWVISCDHATNLVPPSVNGGDLGLPAADMARHISHDVGALGVARALGGALEAPVIGSRFSRLVIDPNRGEEDPTLLMRLYDGSVIPANRHAGAAERARRLELFHRPYHAALARLMAARTGPVLVAVHSFTPRLAGRPPRPWQIGILSAADRRLSEALMAQLRDADFAAWVARVSGAPLVIGDNQPYSGHLPGDSIDRHALRQGHLNTLIEIRNDLIADPADQRAWGERLAPLLRRALGQVTADPVAQA
ncbi:N-formylglutamate amidohydrolase [Mangrovicoccus algicola]|uniref:N-formylglutamate amidohydrolase n=1 Tax=Mangrovicoccus algicola TaxID=2771008 RepID=A0A8J6YT78_9RHOB|nr:N-formylglutamate amidohydrolase [Mangrovicoccus algicola]MBE3638748.1 N-formylglutamate amidohydrolase [Mangrovicoccus algicola]